MAERKQALQKRKLILIKGRFDRNGLHYSVKKFPFVEKDKSYWIDGGKRRVLKSKIDEPFSLFNNDLKLTATIRFDVWCFNQTRGLNIVEKKILDQYTLLKSAIERLTNGLTKHIRGIRYILESEQKMEQMKK